MKAEIATVLDCPPEKVWEQLQTSALLQRVAWPLVRFAPVGGQALPERWAAGTTVELRVYILGFIPLGTHRLVFETLDPESRAIQTRESDALVRRWDHLISLKADRNGRTLYRDAIEIDAGVLTILVWAWAHGFYRHRQRRWRAIAKTLR